MVQVPKKILVVDDDPAARLFIEEVLSDVGFVCQTAASGHEALAIIENDRDIAIVVSDIVMPGLDGVRLGRFIRERFPDRSWLQVIFVTGHGDVPMAVEAMHYGAFDFIQKPFRDQELLDRINQALAWDHDHRSDEDYRRDVQERFQNLTPREREVFQLLALGKSNKEVAKALGMSLGTAKKHRENLQRKLDCHSAAELARLAIREGLLST